MGTTKLIPLALLVLTTACAANHEASEAEDEGLLGCYQFEWTETARELGLPWGFELLPGELEGWNIPDAHPAMTWQTASRRIDHPFAYWREVADTVKVGHPGGGGFALTLREEGRTLRGMARPVGDAVRFGESFEPRQGGMVTAQRVVCPSEG